MKKLAEILVTRRILIFSLMMLLAVFSAFLIPRVKVNTDMTKYLPESSSMKKGIDILMEEFTGLEDLATGGTTVRVMFRGLTEKEKPAMEKELAALLVARAEARDFSPLPAPTDFRAKLRALAPPIRSFAPGTAQRTPENFRRLMLKAARL